MSDPGLREVLLKTTARLFQQKGYAAVTLRTIAAEAGVTTGSLYYHFSDKEEIVREILETGHRHIYEEVRHVVAELGPSATWAEKVRACMRVHVAALFDPGSFPAANIRIYAHVPEHLREEAKPGRRAYERFWVELLGSSKRETGVPARHLAMFFFGAANWTFEWHREGRETIEEIADDLARLFIGPEPEQGPDFAPMLGAARSKPRTVEAQPSQRLRRR
jgi:TetR/AcrR family transcriptional regulator, cholesterol catabolism regulator